MSKLHCTVNCYGETCPNVIHRLYGCNFHIMAVECARFCFVWMQQVSLFLLSPFKWGKKAIEHTGFCSLVAIHKMFTVTKNP